MEVEHGAAGPRHRWTETLADWARERRDDATERLDRAERRYPAVRFLLSVVGHDRIAGGRLLAGALAFRLFLWLLPACLVLVGLLGFVTPGSARGATAEIGLGGTTATTIATATAQAHEARWWLVATGLVALFSASLSLARTLWVATLLAWQLPVVKLRHPPRAAGLVVGFLGSALGLVLAANWLRTISYTVGLVVAILLVVVYALLGWIILAALPRPSHVSVSELIPGALLIGVGAEGLHLVAALFLAHQLSSASQLYGALGSAATVLLWCYFLARVLIGGTSVNRAWASMLEARGGVSHGGEGGPEQLSARTVVALARQAWREVREPVGRVATAAELEASTGPITMTVWFFDDPRGAHRALRTLVDLERRGVVRILGAGLVSWPASSPRPRTRHATSTNLGGVLLPAFWGLLLGVVFWVPLTDGDGATDRATDRTAYPALEGVGLGEEFVRTVRAGVRPGSSALLVLSAGRARHEVGEALDGAGPTPYETRLTPDQEARLRDVFAS